MNPNILNVNQVLTFTILPSRTRETSSVIGTASDRIICSHGAWEHEAVGGSLRTVVSCQARVGVVIRSVSFTVEPGKTLRAGRLSNTIPVNKTKKYQKQET